jgi:hypothetical protein
MVITESRETYETEAAARGWSATIWAVTVEYDDTDETDTVYAVIGRHETIDAIAPIAAAETFEGGQASDTIAPVEVDPYDFSGLSG